MNSDRHNAVSSWFLGPRGENFEYLVKLFVNALQTQLKGRLAYFPGDMPFITKDMQASSEFKGEFSFTFAYSVQLLTFSPDSIGQLERVVNAFSTLLTRHNVPFWNPRYNGHMLMDTTLPGIAGYITTMICLYLFVMRLTLLSANSVDVILLVNPNNVAVEASPLTTYIERDVGRQLCDMIGIDQEKGWGHITCDGSMANLESIWAGKYFAVFFFIRILTPCYT